MNHDIPGDSHLLEALRAALPAGAMAAFALDRGAIEEGELTLAGLRDFWAPVDGHYTDGRKAPEPPQ